MDIDLKQYAKLQQQMVMTPQLQQAIKLLQLSRLELVDVLRQEMEDNPVLEEVLEGEEKAAPEVTEGAERIPFEGFDEAPEFYTPREKSDRPSFENFLTKKGGLTDHLLWQLRLSSLAKEEETVGALIIGNLDEDGYLRTDVADLARASRSSDATVLRGPEKNSGI